MRTAEVMTRNVQTISPDTPAEEAWELMRRKNIHHLVVMDGSWLAGVFSHWDAGGGNGASVRARSRVRDLMTAAVVTTNPDATIRRVANLMRGRTIGCVPVFKGSRLVGIVTVSDLLELLGRGRDRPSKSARHELNHRVPHKKRNGASGVW